MLAYTYDHKFLGHLLSYMFSEAYFQSCKIPDLKISWSKAPLVHDVLHWKSIPFFQDVAFKYPIYISYHPVVGFLLPSSLTVHF